MKQTIVNMQKYLNRMDSAERNKNVIITGLPENKITNGNEELEGDKRKVKWILKQTRNQHFNDDFVETLNIKRLGVEKSGYNRVIKIILPSISDRDKFLENSNKLIEAGNSWSKVYMKKDQHTVYIGENNRLKDKANKLKKAPGNANKEIKIHNGKIMIDNVKVDENLFFP